MNDTATAPELTRAQVDALPDAAFAADERGDIVYWSASAERLLGWPAELAVGSSCAMLLEGVDRAGAAVCHRPCPLAEAAGSDPGDTNGCAWGFGRVGWQPPGSTRAIEPHPDMLASLPDGRRLPTVIVAFPAVLEGRRVLVHLLRGTPAPDRDLLTGALGREAFAQRAIEEQHRAARHERPLALALVDLDTLKGINDRHGHDAGDRALVSVAEALGRGRREDLLGRWGGDEFVLLLPETDRFAAAGHLETALVELRKRTAGAVPQGLDVAFSAGVVDLGAEPLETALQRADALLYRAKRRGRRRVVV